MLTGIPAEKIGEWWPKIGPVLERAAATSHGKERAVDYKGLAENRLAQIWVWLDNDCAVKMALVTEIINYPGGAYLRGRAVAGEIIGDWIDSVEIVEDWGREHGCRGVEWAVRPGFEKFLKPHGYEKTHVFLEKSLETG